MRHPNADRAQAVIAWLNAGYVDELDRQLTEDIVWHVGGSHPLSGDYKGYDAVRDYHTRVAELTDGTLTLETLDILASKSHLGIFLRVRASAGDENMDTTMMEAVTLADDGRWAEFWALADDQPQVDRFWKAVAK